MRVPKYCLHRGTGQAFVKIDGRHIYLGKYGSPESRAKYAALITGQPATEAKPAASTVADMVAAFLDRNPAEYPPDSPEPRQFVPALRPLAKIAGQWRIWKKDVLAYLESKRHRPANVQVAPVVAASQGISASTIAKLAAQGIRI